MITKGGLDAVIRSLAIEYAKNNIRVNAVALRQIDTPLHKGTISDARDIAEAVVYLTEARHVTGEVLHVDGGAHVGRWYALRFAARRCRSPIAGPWHSAPSRPDA